MTYKNNIGETIDLDKISQELGEYKVSAQEVIDKLTEKERLREDIKAVTKHLSFLKQKLAELERK